MIETTYGYIMNHCNWDHACNVLGLNPWMFNEGLCSEDEECTLTFEQAEKIGLKISVE